MLFSVAGFPQTTLLRDHGAKEVLPTLHTYCHIKFRKFENYTPEAPTSAACFIGGNHARVNLPILVGLPGGADRRSLVRKMRRRLGHEFQVYGPGWPKGWSSGRIPYDQQADYFAQSRVTVNWEHYPTYWGYFSDRLPIALLTGRPHVTSSQPGLDWAPDGDSGFYHENSPGGVVSRTAQLLNDDPAKVAASGLNASRWVSGRLSHREAARHIMSLCDLGVAPVGRTPWNLLAS